MIKGYLNVPNTILLQATRLNFNSALHLPYIGYTSTAENVGNVDLSRISEYQNCLVEECLSIFLFTVYSPLELYIIRPVVGV